MAQPDRIARAERELEAARLLLDKGLNPQACGHAYYAAFYAAQEALTTVGKSAKTHTGTARQFGELLRAEGVPEVGRWLSQLEQKREDTTYRFLDASAEDATRMIERAEQVIATVKELLPRLAAENEDDV